MILGGQLAMLFLIGIALAFWLRHFPYPSPLIRPILPARIRWPEGQVRGWLQSGRPDRRFLAYFTRDPEREAPPGPDLLAPADGLLSSLNTQNGLRYVVIALSFWDVHVQRCPLAGRVVSIEALGDAYTDGEGLDFAFLREKRSPVQTRIIMETDIGRIAIRLITSVAARRIETWVKVGDVVQRGQRIGRILLGSTVVLELPERQNIIVTTGQRVWAGTTVIATADGRTA